MLSSYVAITVTQHETIVASLALSSKLVVCNVTRAITDAMYCTKYPWHGRVTSAVLGLSLDKLTHPWLEVSQNTGVTPAVPGLSWDSLPQSPVSRIAGVTPAFLGLSWDSLRQSPVSRIARVTPAVPGLSWDSLILQHPSGRVSQNARVIPAVLGLS